MYILASIAFCIIFIFVPAREYYKLQQALKSEKEQGRTYQVYSNAKWLLIIQAFMLVFSISIGVISGPTDTSPEKIMIAISIAMSGSAIGAMIGALLNRRLLYNDKGFLLKNHFVAYKSIKHMTRRKSVLGVAEVETLKGETMTLTNKCAGFLQEMAKKK